ncbi:unnamed protein product, partial [Vitis vinifera]|uniref:Cellulose synthase-like protein E6 n=1 Tax=Vitis vinifera TaxID=29760 RepID=D7U408_VITVI
MRGRWEEMASFLCFKQRLQSITMTTRNNNERIEENASVLEETGKVLASCSYEDYTQWGKEMGLKYGCPVEDTLTGLSIQCRGWKSIYFTIYPKLIIIIKNHTPFQISSLWVLPFAYVTIKYAYRLAEFILFDRRNPLGRSFLCLNSKVKFYL